jgi:dUTP pyrophosphatase
MSELAPVRRSAGAAGVQVQVVQLDPELPLPARARRGDAGVDLLARNAAVLRRGGGRALVPTGLAIAVPEGFGGFVLPRSGLAAKQGVTVLNGPGLIDAGYRGEVMVPLVNTDPDTDVHIARGERIAQLLVLPVPTIEWMVTDALPPTLGEGSDARGDGGHGSSGR